MDLYNLFLGFKHVNMYFTQHVYFSIVTAHL